MDQVQGAKTVRRNLESVGVHIVTVYAEEILDADADLVQHAQLREEVQDLLGDAVDFLFKS